jgi:hypothetical protein
VDGAIKANPNVTPDARSTPTPAPFAVIPAHYSLSVPPSGGEAPLFETSKDFAMDPVEATASILWSSSDTRVAQVDAKGRVSALRAGTTVITAMRQDGREATASVTVEAKGRLTLTPTGLPPGAAILARLYGSDGTLLATSEDGKFDRTSERDLSAEVEARLAGTLVAVGRIEGMSLYANKVKPYEVPLNVPSLTTAEVSGGPGASVTLRGTGLGHWIKHWIKQSTGHLAPWLASVTATVDGKPATVTVPPSGDGTRVTLKAPMSFDGTNPYRELHLAVGGIPLAAGYRVLGTLGIDTPDLEVPVMGRGRFLVTAKDTQGQVVTSPSLTWEVRPYDERPGGMGGEPVGGIDEAGEFMAWREGKGLIIVRSGTLEATTSVTVTEGALP